MLTFKLRPPNKYLYIHILSVLEKCDILYILYFSQTKVNGMAKEKDDKRMISFRISNSVDERISKYCKLTGATRTSVIERAVNFYLDDYDREREFLDKNRNSIGR